MTLLRQVGGAWVWRDCFQHGGRVGNSVGGGACSLLWKLHNGQNGLTHKKRKSLIYRLFRPHGVLDWHGGCRTTVWQLHQLDSTFGPLSWGLVTTLLLQQLNSSHMCFLKPCNAVTAGLWFVSALNVGCAVVKCPCYWLRLLLFKVNQCLIPSNARMLFAFSHIEV